MIEQLFPLKLPPGYMNNGTAYQAKGRWYTGNLVRFYNGTVQPVGGWVKRTLTGAAIAGAVRAAITWQVDPSTDAAMAAATPAATYTAIGTTTGLYVVAGTVVYNITPPTIETSQPYAWQLAVFGNYLVAVVQQDSYVDLLHGNVFVWTGDTGTLAARAYEFDGGPGAIYGVVTTPERFLMLLRGADWAPLGLPSDLGRDMNSGYVP